MSGLRITVRVPASRKSMPVIDGLVFEEDLEHRPVRGSAFFSAVTADIDMDRLAFVESVKRVEPKAIVEYQILSNVDPSINELANLMASGIANVGEKVSGKGKATAMSTAVKRMLAIEQGMEPISARYARGPIVKESVFMLPVEREMRERGRSATRKNRGKGKAKASMKSKAKKTKHNTSRRSENRPRRLRSRSGSYRANMNYPEY